MKKEQNKSIPSISETMERAKEWWMNNISAAEQSKLFYKYFPIESGGWINDDKILNIFLSETQPKDNEAGKPEIKNRYQQLFFYMAQDHGVNLLESDMQEIENILFPPTYPYLIESTAQTKEPESERKIEGLEVCAYISGDGTNWYGKNEMFRHLKGLNYSDEIGNELAELFATYLQGAYNKGVSTIQSQLQKCKEEKDELVEALEEINECLSDESEIQYYKDKITALLTKLK